jgi:hypothetical protein
MITLTDYSDLAKKDSFVSHLAATDRIRRSVMSEVGRHTIIAGGMLRDIILGIPPKDMLLFPGFIYVKNLESER